MSAVIEESVLGCVWLSCRFLKISCGKSAVKKLLWSDNCGKSESCLVETTINCEFHRNFYNATELLRDNLYANWQYKINLYTDIHESVDFLKKIFIPYVLCIKLIQQTYIILQAFPQTRCKQHLKSCRKGKKQSRTEHLKSAQADGRCAGRAQPTNRTGTRCG